MVLCGGLANIIGAYMTNAFARYNSAGATQHLAGGGNETDKQHRLAQRDGHWSFSSSTMPRLMRSSIHNPEASFRKTGTHCFSATLGNGTSPPLPVSP